MLRHRPAAELLDVRVAHVLDRAPPAAERPQARPQRGQAASSRGHGLGGFGCEFVTLGGIGSKQGRWNLSRRRAEIAVDGVAGSEEPLPPAVVHLLISIFLYIVSIRRYGGDWICCGYSADR